MYLHTLIYTRIQSHAHTPHTHTYLLTSTPVVPSVYVPTVASNDDANPLTRSPTHGVYVGGGTMGWCWCLRGYVGPQQSREPGVE